MTAEISRKQRKFEEKKEIYQQIIKDNIKQITRLRYEIEHVLIKDYIEKKCKNFSLIEKENHLIKTDIKYKKKYMKRVKIIAKIRNILKFIIAKFTDQEQVYSFYLVKLRYDNFLKIKKNYADNLLSLQIIHCFLFKNWSAMSNFDIKTECLWAINDLNLCRNYKYVCEYEDYDGKYDTHNIKYEEPFTYDVSDSDDDDDAEFDEYFN